ncbi:2-oxoglutarate dehydrogenase complex dihydrolipoyllysine-residue succinyltransferase [Cytophagaceae bacterium DM2B3-1]|uniref:Dihydrolipoyllysine-residue succinyltransferase component of 2-oxoglutarate dehydrogenase complex n=1 Tax=Xanthocytophaga flava TaxID=3048013 RepID=A0ABT7CTY1_9BACT|nr:2-oxoglutarate dehydrogenase complex dihydrolipoyllysine-residue succinyltransferase [Xanthocytophaga flavus]MDJ1468622.1 2-oxoglutarate dehydrogenase complex dihydrolipoyllysine-residue succinyltransferase [Xanthocytophaga flavus]MDJ1496402.1 2-oxoglutarate dehydrogenase complex dihydrolipoyllysine-residue succinyltransferase [Xanthocytophaga flavus]
MALDIKIPAVGESISEVTISKWNKKDGETVQMDEVLCELESDKATFELNAPAAGVLHIVVQEGETISIDTLIARIDEANGQPKASTPTAQATAPAEEAKPAAATGQTVEMKVPTVGESITEVTIGTWHKNDGDQVQLNDLLCEIESDKATFELTAEQAGILRIVATQGTTLPIGGLICKIEVTAGGSQPVSQATATPSQPVPAAQTTPSGDKTYATGTPSPAANKILAEKGVKPEDVQGTGVDGRITKNDAVNAQKPVAANNAQPPVSKPAEKTSAPKQPVVSGERTDRREKMTSLRKTVARRLVAVKNETAMLTTFNEVDMKPIMDLRAKYKDKFKEKHSVGLGFMSFFTKACCVALQEWPAVNAMIDGDEIVYHQYADISIAVSSPRGLVVPIIRNAEQMSFAEIEAEIVRLAGKAKENKLTIDDMTGGTFTITNGGIFGSMLSTPIINAPQTAILGMHNIVERPVVVEGQIVIRPIMYLALSYDHRIIDGREAVSFLVRVKQLLEDPTRLLLEV